MEGGLIESRMEGGLIESRVEGGTCLIESRVEGGASDRVKSGERGSDRQLRPVRGTVGVYENRTDVCL